MDFYKTVILLLFGMSFSLCSELPLRAYHFISTPKTWKDAQLYCREKYTDLATFESMEDLNQLSRPAGTTGLVWIGLHDDPASWKGTLGNDSNSWRWSTTGQTVASQYTNWATGEPNYDQAKQSCVEIVTGVWNDLSCQFQKPFICYTDNGNNQKTYVHIPNGKTWSDAQTYCRQHYTDLAVITNTEENTEAQSAASTPSWIGLYRVPWTWSDKNPSTFTNWRSGHPDNYNFVQHCVCQDVNNQWGDEPCSKTYPFICYEGRKSQLIFKVRMESDADMTDPAVNERLLQQLTQMLENQGVTGFKLRWRTPPKLVEEEPPKK